MFTPKASIQTRSEASRLNTFASTDQTLWESLSKEVEEKILSMIEGNRSFEEIHQFASSSRSRIAKELKHETGKDNTFGQYRDSNRELELRQDIYSNRNFANSSGANYPILIKLKATILSQKNTKQVIKKTTSDNTTEFESLQQGSTYLPDLIELTYGSAYANLSFSMTLTPNKTFPSYLEPKITVTHGYMSHPVFKTAMAGLNDFFIRLKKTDDEQTYLNMLGLLAYDLSRLMFLERGGAAVHGWIIRALINHRFKKDVGNLSLYGIPFDIYAQVQLDRDDYARDFARSITRAMKRVDEGQPSKSSKEERVSSTFPDFLELSPLNSEQKTIDLRAQKGVLSTSIDLPTPKDKSPHHSPYLGFFSHNKLTEGYSFVDGSQCLFRGDTRKPEFIKACGGFNPWITHDLYQLLDQMDQCEDTQEYRRLNQLVDNMVASHQVLLEEVQVIQQIIALKSMLAETTNEHLKSTCNEEIKTLEERLKLISQPQYRIEQLKYKLSQDDLNALSKATFEPLDLGLHRKITQVHASGFVSLTASLAVASTFSNKISRDAKSEPVGYVYVVRARGTLVANEAAHQGFEHEYSLPGGLDWRDVLAFREVSYDSKADCFRFSGPAFLNKEFSEKLKPQADEIMQLLGSRKPGKEEQDSPFCSIT
ncbi:hypothetical protein DIZ81_00405 [Legionella taurinensis]|uniref:Uncharacterized protein n=1 Tax=Legionella taurinensis TaxID=70611 RepID=A0AB38N9B6_9GAMM|nr:hypothetical protein [Legionella taurinensis]MDX1836664.1 hypothetical protein [Legionella taurinensis]PUT42880.1 hypothetical protein DB744_00410 [Legionella taurinensis]PUT45435.1 hypothetical protein DB746_00410 [Legionella taurinensis]PUT46990.1 hypothetical protein DB743_03590 [Legionella taurinensis]PUT49202.1 hypothetical protein DB745_00410 [Legionella taurinensis]